MLRIAFPSTEIDMSDEVRLPRKCEKCGSALHWKNKGDACPGCRPDVETSTPTRAKSSAGSKALKKNFTVLAEALGEDPDELVGIFMEGWIKRAREAVQKATETL